MSDPAKRMLGVGVACAVAVWLLTLEVSEHADEWREPAEPIVEAFATSRTRSALADAEVAGSLYHTASAPIAPAAPIAAEATPLDAPLPEDWHGRLRVDADGHFVATPEARALFEDFHDRYAGRGDAVIRGRILLHLLDSLPPRAADEAIDVLDRWEALRRAENGDDAPADEAARIALRREILGDALATALY